MDGEQRTHGGQMADSRRTDSGRQTVGGPWTDGGQMDGERTADGGQDWPATFGTDAS